MVQFRTRGFGELNLFEGNVAYVNLIGFRREDLSKVDDIMSLFSTADAIIIDLRENGGGSVLGEYWSNYFLKDGIHLNSRYTRVTDKTVNYTTEKVKGRKRLEMPIFILTSNFTFSAAEGFAYDLQSRKRAIIVGETTGGGAHPVNFIRLPKGFGLIVPDSESINPITKSNWEGTGVIPDVKTSKEKALNKAIELAKIAAKKYRETPFNTLKTILDKKNISTTDENKINELFSVLLEREHLEDFMINNMGYSYLDTKNVTAALAIFKSNLKFLPNSPNAHDSYAEALAINKQTKLALKYYKKAVALAKKNSDRSLNYFVETLEKFKKENNLE
jgi:tetratricopeptide (TPR) repeat protein